MITEMILTLLLYLFSRSLFFHFISLLSFLNRPDTNYLLRENLLNSIFSICTISILNRFDSKDSYQTPFSHFHSFWFHTLQSYTLWFRLLFLFLENQTVTIYDNLRSEIMQYVGHCSNSIQSQNCGSMFRVLC